MKFVIEEYVVYKTSSTRTRKKIRSELRLTIGAQNKYIEDIGFEKLEVNLEEK